MTTAVRREEDGELCGFVEERDGRWIALSVFGGVLHESHDRDDARRYVLDHGLASLAERWVLRGGPDARAPETVLIVEARSCSVTVSFGPAAVPGVESLTIPRTDLDAGLWRLELEVPANA